MNVTEHAYQSLLRTLGIMKAGDGAALRPVRMSRPQWRCLPSCTGPKRKGRTACACTSWESGWLFRPPSVTGVVDRLERDGLVARSKTEGDRRVRRVRLTAAGRALRKRLLAVHARQIQKVMSGLDAREQATLAEFAGPAGRAPSHLDAADALPSKGILGETMKRVIAVVLLAAVGCGSGSKTSAFQTVKVKKGNIVATISATGTLEPEEVVDIGAQVVGLILSFGTDVAGKPVD